ncbi:MULTISPECIES: bis(5'-nucleosyl)-tetraphosphatase (symmetrical) YqeK [Listeria]|uniref:bis(5'-nucleosyl)-tetraphosphatase (symmetrical) YqeK n=1 Tax=Listeria TaxID=1637 RepID=UPI000B58E72C|nr:MULTISPECIES: bis(5'-nucleosyl)-tetraphosphatase (symmetrical) YqeK [Listeria]
MNRDEMLEKVRQAMPEKRFIHTLGVEETAIKLAKIYFESEEKASIAAILHDYAKYIDDAKARDIIVQEKMNPEFLRYQNAIWHAPVGAYLAEHEFGITDEAILDAIRWHTTGTENMSTLDKIIFLADYTEPGRDFPGVDEARKITAASLDKGMLFALGRTIGYLASKEQPIFPDTFLAYNHYAFLIKEGDVLKFE